jgi:hypothetical protein
MMILQSFFALVKDSTLNISRCFDPGHTSLMEILINHIPQFERMPCNQGTPLIAKTLSLVQVLGSYSISTTALKRLFRLARSSVIELPPPAVSNGSGSPQIPTAHWRPGGGTVLVAVPSHPGFGCVECENEKINRDLLQAAYNEAALRLAQPTTTAGSTTAGSTTAGSTTAGSTTAGSTTAGDAGRASI